MSRKRPTAPYIPSEAKGFATIYGPIVGNAIRAHREKAGYLSVPKAAEAAGIHAVQWYEMEAGRRLPTPATIYRLIYRFGMTAEELFPPIPASEAPAESA